ncbi:MAG: amidohydrolase [Acidimicrobiia bacterium]
MTVHRGARIHGHPGANALRVSAGRIVEIGAAAGMGDTDVRDHGTGVILPGLRDGHIHPLGLAAAAGQVDLTDAATIAEVVERIRAHAATASPDRPIIATGVDDERLSEGRLPSAADLDSAASDRPVLVYRHCSHVASANSLALAAGGIVNTSSDPTGGRIRRKPNGSANGILEEAAITPVATALGSALLSPDADALRTVLRGVQRRGVVAIDAMASVGSSMWCGGGDELATIASVGDDSPVTITVFVICDTPEELQQAAHRLGTSGPMVKFGGWKGFADGSLGARTAALRAPYTDDPGTNGMLMDIQIREMARAATALGGVAAVHAIGDAAVEQVLTIAESLDPGSVRIEHASVADPDQIGRMAAAGVTASIQPSFVPADSGWIGRRLGPHRQTWAYPFASMWAAGVALRGGSDAPVESPDPFAGIRDACGPGPEALSPSQAVDIYTATALQPGAPATFIVCSDDPLHVPVEEISEIEVHELWIQGVEVDHLRERSR